MTPWQPQRPSGRQQGRCRIGTQRSVGQLASTQGPVPAEPPLPAEPDEPPAALPASPALPPAPLPAAPALPLAPPPDDPAAPPAEMPPAPADGSEPPALPAPAFPPRPELPRGSSRSSPEFAQQTLREAAMSHGAVRLMNQLTYHRRLHSRSGMRMKSSNRSVKLRRERTGGVPCIRAHAGSPLCAPRCAGRVMVRYVCACRIQRAPRQGPEIANVRAGEPWMFTNKVRPSARTLRPQTRRRFARSRRTGTCSRPR